MTGRRVLGTSLLLAAAVGLNAHAVSCRIGSRVEKGALQQRWTLAQGGVQALVAARFAKGAPEALAVLGTRAVSLVDSEGKVLARFDAPQAIVASATGDLDGDGADEVLVVQAGPSPAVEVLGEALRPRARLPLGNLKDPVRVLAIDLDGDGRREVVAAGKAGAVAAFDLEGSLLWTYAPGFLGPAADAEPRGLDDVKLGRDRHVAVASQGGDVALLNGEGVQAWRLSAGKLRRMRAFDIDGDGTGEILLGTDSGSYIAWNARGQQVARWGLGDAVTEIRPVEIDGDPRRSEVFVGGKKGRFNFMRGVEELVESSLDSRITAARGVDTDGDGRDEVFAGTERGTLVALRYDGHVVASAALGGRVEAIASVVSPLRERLVVAGGGPKVAAFRLSRVVGPGWYNPWTAAVPAWVAIAAMALVLARRRPEAAPTAPATQARPSGARARRLDVAAARIRSWAAAGKLRPEDAEDRLKQLEKQIAESRKPARAAGPTSPPPPPRR